jgi:hypothetical protein
MSTFTVPGLSLPGDGGLDFALATDSILMACPPGILEKAKRPTVAIANAIHCNMLLNTRSNK